MSEDTSARRCTTERKSGSFCNQASIPDAPFPICVKHAAEIYAFLRGRVEGVTPDVLAGAGLVRRRNPAARDQARGRSMVYYVQIGERIKIGTSVNVRQRMAAYPPDRRLLATEPGGASEERARLSEFAEYRVLGREWFHPGPRLMLHVESLRRRSRST